MESSDNSQSLSIDIVSDVVCPWCIIGYKQLEKALAARPVPVATQIQWHPFELNPHMPEEGQNLREHLAQKYGTTPEGSQAARKRLTDIGESLGFHFDYFDGMRMVNTFRAHQLLYWSGLHDRQTALKLALFEAFFSHREDVNDPEVLLRAVQRVGLPIAEARELLEDGRYAATVREEQRTWLEQEVHAVPTFFFNRRYSVPGAQDADTFTRIMDRLLDPVR